MFAVQRHFFSRQLRVRRERHFFFSRQLYFLFTALLLASMQRCTSATQSARCFLISVSQKRSTIQPLSRSSMVFSRSRSTLRLIFSCQNLVQLLISRIPCQNSPSQKTAILYLLYPPIKMRMINKRVMDLFIETSLFLMTNQKRLKVGEKILSGLSTRRNLSKFIYYRYEKGGDAYEQ